MAGSGNAVARRLHVLLGPGIPATARGRLYAIEDVLGWYPGLVPDPAGEAVHGFLHESTWRFAQDDLAAIDRYENFDPGSPDQSEFVRREIVVESGSQRLSAHAYVLNSLPGKAAVTIANGCFSSFLRQRNLRPFGE